MRRHHDRLNRSQRRTRRRRGAVCLPASGGRAEPHAACLHHVDELALGGMVPGDIVLLSEAESLRSAVESVFFALLACPVCGTLGLLTSPQYLGTEPVVCGSKNCSCRFRIDNQARVVYLPAA